MMLTGIYHATGFYGHYFSRLPSEVGLAGACINGDDLAYHYWVAEDAARYGLTIFYSIHDIAFYRPAMTGPWALRPDWKARCAAVEVKVRALRDAGVLHSIYVADEPYANGLKVDALTKVNAWWQARGYATMVVEVSGCARQLRPPYTYFGFDTYYSDGKTWRTIDPTKWANLLKKTGANVLVTQAFNTLATPIPPQAPQDALVTARIKIILRFLWPTIPSLDLKGLGSLYVGAPPRQVHGVGGVVPGQMPAMEVR